MVSIAMFQADLQDKALLALCPFRQLDPLNCSAFRHKHIVSLHFLEYDAGDHLSIGFDRLSRFAVSHKDRDTFCRIARDHDPLQLKIAGEGDSSTPTE